MNIIEIIYLILLWLLVGGYITLLIEVKKLNKFKDVFIKFMKMQRDANNAQVEHNIRLVDFITHLPNEIRQALGKEESDVRKSD